MDKRTNLCNGGYSFILAHGNEKKTTHKDKWKNPSDMLAGYWKTTQVLAKVWV